MPFSYDKLWKILIDEKMNKTDLQKAINTTPATVAKLGKNENVNMNTLAKICEYFDCDIGDIMEFRKGENKKIWKQYLCLVVLVV